MTSPAKGETLYLYVDATTQVVSAVLVVERVEEWHTLPVQRLVYVISEVLSETKMRYPQIQKQIYAVVLTRRKLCTTSRPTPSPWCHLFLLER